MSVIGATGRTFDVAIVGGGIIGLHTAFQLQRRAPDLSVAVFEKGALHGTTHTRARMYTGTHTQAHTGTHRHTHACTRIHTPTNDAHPRSFRGLTPASTYCTHPGRGLGEGSSGYSSAVLRCFYSSDEMSRMAADGLQVHSAWRDYLKLASPEAQLSRVRSARGAAALTGCKADRRRLPCSL